MSLNPDYTSLPSMYDKVSHNEEEEKSFEPRETLDKENSARIAVFSRALPRDDIMKDPAVLEVLKDVGARLEDDSVILGQKSFKPLTYESDMLRALSYETRNPKKAQNIYDLFKHYFLPMNLPEDIVNEVARWLVKRSVYLGISHYSHIAKFQYLIEKPNWKISKETKAALLNAIEKLISELEKAEKMNIDPNSNRVVVLTTRSGGGHYAVAMAINEFLRTTHFIPHVVNVDDFLDADPYYQLTGKKIGSLYEEIHQKQGDLEKFNNYWHFVKHFLPLYIKNRQNERIRDALNEIKPFLIINTAVYIDRHVSVSYSTSIPHLFVTTDYDIGAPLDPAIKEGIDKISRIAVVDDKDSIFASIKQRLQDAKINTQIANFQNSQANEPGAIDRSFYLLGYPVQECIKKLDQDNKQKLYEKFGLLREEKNVLVMMGSQGKPSLFEIVHLLLSLENSGLNAFIFAGRNDPLKVKIEEEIRTARQNNVAQKMKVLSFVPPETINEYLNIADVMISKPGGATTSGVLITETPIIMYDMNEHCEEANKRYLINSGIGFFAQQLADIPALLQQVLDKGAELNPEFRPINWQEKLEHYLKGFFKTKTGSV